MLSRGGSEHVARRRDKGREAEISDKVSTRWSERELREVSRRGLSMLCRTLEADTREPEGEEPGNPAMRGQEARGMLARALQRDPCQPRG